MSKFIASVEFICKGIDTHFENTHWLCLVLTYGLLSKLVQECEVGEGTWGEEKFDEVTTNYI